MAQPPDKVKRLQDLKAELKTHGVEAVTPLSGMSVNSQLKTADALVKAKGTELRDLMQRPRETANDRSLRSKAAQEERKSLRHRGRVSVRLRAAIPK